MFNSILDVFHPPSSMWWHHFPFHIYYLIYFQSYHCVV